MRQAAVIALLGFAAASAERGRLVAVRAAADAQASIVELEADRPLSFTTLKLSGPPRIVVDLADTELGDVAREQDVADGTVRRVAVAAAGARTARVVIELAGESEFDVRAAGATLEVRVQRLVAIAGADPASTSKPTPTPTTNPASTSTPTSTPTTNSTTNSTSTPNPTSTATASSASTEQKAPEIQEVRERATLPTVALVAAGAPPPEKQVVPASAAPRAAASASRPPRRTLALAAITGIGFRPLSGGEVLVRSDRPLEYGVSSGDRTVLLHLPRAAIPHPNNRRPLDTRFFDGPVQRVVPLQVSGGTDVRIELRGPARVHLQQSGSLLTVSFTPSN